MKVIRRRSKADNCIFEIGTKRVFFDLALLKRLAGKRIGIDILEGSSSLGEAFMGGGTVYLNFLKLVGKKENNSVIKKEIVHALAHEVRHTLQKEGDFGSFWKLVPVLTPHLNIFLISTALLAIGGLVFNFLFKFNSLIPVILNFLTFIAVSPLLLYRFCPVEMDAERFAAAALRDDEWLEVVKVEDKDTP